MSAGLEQHQEGAGLLCVDGDIWPVLADAQHKPGRMWEAVVKSNWADSTWYLVAVAEVMVGGLDMAELVEAIR